MRWHGRLGARSAAPASGPLALRIAAASLMSSFEDNFDSTKFCVCNQTEDTSVWAPLKYALHANSDLRVRLRATLARQMRAVSMMRMLEEVKHSELTTRLELLKPWGEVINHPWLLVSNAMSLS